MTDSDSDDSLCYEFTQLVERTSKMMKVLNIPSDSSVVRHASYDADRRELVVTLNSKKSYRYLDVPASVARAFEAAPSAGRFFSSKIRPKFDFGEIR